MLALLNSPVTTATVEAKSKKLQNRVKSPCYSPDIDILILLHNERIERHQKAIEQFLTLLWDSNLKVGSSVRTIAECAVEGAAGLTIITTMIESRL